MGKSVVTPTTRGMVDAARQPANRGGSDTLTMGVRTPVRAKVYGDDLNEIERVSIALEGMLRHVPGHVRYQPP